MYAIIAGLLAVSRLPMLPVRGLLNHPNVTLSITGLFGFEGINWTLPILILMGQTSGASIGNMVAIHNAVSISAATGFKEGEGKLIAAALPFIIYSLAISAIMFIYLAVGMPTFGW